MATENLAVALSGLPLAIELVRIAAEEAERDGITTEVRELRAVQRRLEAHRDGVTHVDYVNGRPVLWTTSLARAATIRYRSDH